LSIKGSSIEEKAVRDSYGYQRISLGIGPLMPGVKYVLIICVGVFLLQFLAPMRILMAFGLIPVLVWKKFFFWQFGTYIFLHASLFHLLFNLFALWMFGSELERLWGTRRFIRYFMITGVGAGICYAIVRPSQWSPVIGASGAIYGILLAYGLIFPNRMVYVWFLFPIRAKYFVMIFGAIELYASITGSTGGIAHVAHLGGMLVGYVYINQGRLLKKLYLLYLRYKARRSKRDIYMVKIKRRDRGDHIH
jgi:membrane associated rhomboid family serine protease